MLISFSYSHVLHAYTFFFSKNTDREAEHRAWCDQVRNSRAGPGKVASCCVALSHASSYHARLVIYPQVVQVLPATEHAPNKLKKKSMRERESEKQKNIRARRSRRSKCTKVLFYSTSSPSRRSSCPNYRRR
jgi:hypothetical protein